MSELSSSKEIVYDNEQKYETEFQENLSECIREFNEKFSSSSLDGQNKLICVCAPGRVNLIGEHIDYNDGFVLPMAIPLNTIIVGRFNNENETTRLCRLRTLETSLMNAQCNQIEFSLNDLSKLTDTSKYHWANYVIGVVSKFKDQSRLASFDAVIKSNVPLGSGLSSSAALEVAAYTFLEHLTNEFTDPREKAVLCQQAEHEYASVPCGIMDQFISTMAVDGNALLIDCRSLESKLYPLDDPSVAVLITNSNVKHSLEGSEYASRRQQCQQVADLLKKNSLRDATLDDLKANKEKIDSVSFRRANHAISEIERTVRASRALADGDLELFGELMNQSHDSLRDDFNVSCDELDELVTIARSTPGVKGSRMTGGGFGGCTVTLVDKANVNELIENIRKNYKGTASFYVCKPCNGARRIQ